MPGGAELQRVRLADRRQRRRRQPLALRAVADEGGAERRAGLAQPEQAGEIGVGERVEIGDRRAGDRLDLAGDEAAQPGRRGPVGLLRALPVGDLGQARSR